jgi:NAD(P)-dependent dehydrogenase (short-subunit alcohol dehydrogenase family)
MIVTGAAKGNGAGVTKAFIDRGYNVAPDSLDFTNSALAPFLKGLSPTGGISDFDDMVDAIVYLTEGRHVTGEVLPVDAGAHNGKW